MKKNALFLLLLIFALSSCTSGSGGKDLCDCYKTFQTSVLAANIDLDAEAAQSELQSVHDNLMTTNADFKNCNSDFFKKSSMSIMCMDGIGDKTGKCVDCEVFKKIIAAGPLIYRMDF